MLKKGLNVHLLNSMYYQNSNKKSPDNQRASQVNVSRTDKLTYYQVSTSNKKILNNSASMAINVKIIAINVG